MNAARRGPRGAFTLTELLAVIATVTLLAGLLLPALRSARASAAGALCIANLRQLAAAAQRYALEYRAYPPGRYDIDGNTHAWDWVMSAPPDPHIVAPGPLWEFTDDPGRVQQCPSFHGKTNGPEPSTGYNYNTTYIAGESPFGQGPEAFRPGIRPSAARRIAQVALFGDGGKRGGTNKHMRAPLDTYWGLSVTYTGAQAFRHQHATNVAYLDGHVAPAGTPCQGALATPSNLLLLGYPENGFLSDDDRAYDPR